MTYVCKCRDCGNTFAAVSVHADRCDHCRGGLRDLPPVPGTGDPYSHGRRT